MFGNALCVLFLLSPSFHAFIPENIRHNKFQRSKDKSTFSLFYENEVTIDGINLGNTKRMSFLVLLKSLSYIIPSVFINCYLTSKYLKFVCLS
jgi:hypothetical protein